MWVPTQVTTSMRSLEMSTIEYDQYKRRLRVEKREEKYEERKKRFVSRSVWIFFTFSSCWEFIGRAFSITVCVFRSFFCDMSVVGILSRSFEIFFFFCYSVYLGTICNFPICRLYAFCAFRDAVFMECFFILFLSSYFRVDCFSLRRSRHAQYIHI